MPNPARNSELDRRRTGKRDVVQVHELKVQYSCRNRVDLANASETSICLQVKRRHLRVDTVPLFAKIADLRKSFKVSAVQIRHTKDYKVGSTFVESGA